MEYKVNNNAPVNHLDNREFCKSMMEKGILSFGTAGDDKIFNSFNSSPMVTTPNVNMPLGAGNYIRPEDIEVRTAIQVADRIAKKSKVGDWGGTKLITFKTKELYGKVSLDDGSANDTLKSSVNYSNFTRGVFPFAGYWGNNDMSRATVGAMNSNLQSDDVKSLMNVMSIAQNQIFFTGVEEKNLIKVGVSQPVYGLINDPNLPDYNTAKQNAGGTSTYWKAKTVNEIYDDFIDSFQRLTNKSGGLVIGSGLSSRRGKLKVAISMGSYNDLRRVQSVGTQWISAYELIKKNLNIADEDFIPVPQFNSVNNESDVFYLIYEEEGTYGQTILNVYQELIRAYPLYQKHSELSQKISSQVSGCVVQYPMFIDRVDGIGKTSKFDLSVY